VSVPGIQKNRLIFSLFPPCSWVQGSGLKVEGSRLKVQGSGFMVEGSGFSAAAGRGAVSQIEKETGEHRTSNVQHRIMYSGHLK
jgi:hypothetical protein